jgi:hypothetical protein
VRTVKLAELGVESFRDRWDERDLKPSGRNDEPA